LVQFEDAESGQMVFRHRPAAFATTLPPWRAGSGAALRQLARSRRSTSEVSTDGGHLDALVRFFDLRKRRLRKR